MENTNINDRVKAMLESLPQKEVLLGCDITEPQIVGNIAMIGLTNVDAPETSPVISLREALRQRKIDITEAGGGFTELRANAQVPTLIRASEGISKAGYQDRVAKQSQVVSETKTLNVYCIEHGRWSRGKAEQWSPINLPVPIRRAVAEGRDQHDIWNMINEYLNEWKVKSESQALSAIFDALGNQFEKFVANFEWWPNQVGMIVIINGVVSGLEFFGATETFQEDGMGLLRESYVPEALRGERKVMLPQHVVESFNTFISEVKENKRRFDYVTYKDEVVYASVI